MSWLKLQLLCGCCCLLVSGRMTSKVAAWQLPTAQDMQHSQERCQDEAAGEDAATLRCLVEQLGLWTDESGFNARRIAKLFAARNQMEELQLLVDYCNNRERRQELPAQWAYEAYKCATSGRFGQWVKDYYVQQQRVLKSKSARKVVKD